MSVVDPLSTEGVREFYVLIGWAAITMSLGSMATGVSREWMCTPANTMSTHGFLKRMRSDLGGELRAGRDSRQCLRRSQLKYRNGKADHIVETAVAFARERWEGSIDCVVPPPPSLHRRTQPAVLIAEDVARSLNVPALSNAVVKAAATQQMKNVPLHERVPLLAAAIQAGTDSVQGRRVLLIDDLWETGSTLRRAAEVLGQMGASEIRALVMTRTK